MPDRSSANGVDGCHHLGPRRARQSRSFGENNNNTEPPYDEHLCILFYFLSFFFFVNIYPCGLAFSRNLIVCRLAHFPPYNIEGINCPHHLECPCTGFTTPSSPSIVWNFRRQCLVPVCSSSPFPTQSFVSSQAAVFAGP